MNNLLGRLRRCKDDRGMMANLRCVLVENKRHRAWPALNRLEVAIDDQVAAFVAGLYATHPEETSNGNFGVTCKAIEQKRGDKQGEDNKLTPTERRFQHLLAAGREEVLERVMRMVLIAKSQGIPVNYVQLESDLGFWTERTKTEWAAAFWAPGAEPIGEEAI
ncbi:type I-E CRISPR-associated protein Cse2/CasB [Geobacter pickeringii]|uniref:CRISPR-associated protein Cse2 n=1 Tax=Geobacter pickeringii TaxID=345632 RepID=A0A0B5BAI3_9BACT|nr:type I-E CRISPR-associated protein Cse2/CasB [Geobacter pickeringii]AJE03587.1 hypothetical protein GPICK_09695 [Geobacter pickeringii]